jgi:hypothetical protein
MTFDQVAIFVSVIVASALTICWSVFKALAMIEESMDELSDEINRSPNRRVVEEKEDV